jgi:hypothetical protein
MGQALTFRGQHTSTQLSQTVVATALVRVLVLAIPTRFFDEGVVEQAS